MTLPKKKDNKHPLVDIRDRCPARDRTYMDRWFSWFCVAVASFSILILAVLLISITVQGISGLNLNFLTHYAEPDPSKAGLGPALWGTIWICITCAALALPIGVGTAILLEEFPPRQRALRWLHSFVQLNINNLAGVPSVVYGILGLTVFVNNFNMLGTPNEPKIEFGAQHYDQFLTAGDRAVRVPVQSDAEITVAHPGMKALDFDGNWVDINIVDSRSEAKALPESEKEFAIVAGRQAGRITVPRPYYFRLPLGRSVFAGALTLMLVILPVVIIASQEAIRGVPSSLREAGLGLGSTRWQVVRNITLPAAIPGIMTGSILAMSRAIGEAAPILIIAGTVFISSSPENLFDMFTVLPLQIYDWAKRPQADFHEIAASGIIVLLMILFAFNALAVLIRQFSSKQLS